MFSELSFKLHNGDDHSEGLSLYQVVNENESTGRGRKMEFNELEVNSCIILNWLCVCKCTCIKITPF